MFRAAASLKTFNGGFAGQRCVGHVSPLKQTERSEIPSCFTASSRVNDSRRLIKNARTLFVVIVAGYHCTKRMHNC
jgi:hypothetical protein